VRPGKIAQFRLTPFPPSFSPLFPISFKTLVCCQARSCPQYGSPDLEGQAQFSRG
jgi:hypothetical protein